MPAFVSTLTQNWKLKLLALALAVLLWVVVSAEQVTSNWIPIPLQVRVNDPEFQLIRTSVPPEVEVRFSGPGRELWDLVVRRPPLILSVSDLDTTMAVFGLDPDMVQLPSQLAVRPLDVRPGAVTLAFNRVETRMVPVRPRVAVGPAEGWTLVDTLEIQPDRVRIRGLQRDLRGIESIPTAPFSLGADDSVFSRTVPLDTSGMAGVSLSATQVRISGQVDRVVQHSFQEVPISVGEGVNIRPRSVTVSVRGPRSRVQAFTPASFRVVIAIDSIPVRVPAEGVLVPLRVERLPAGIGVEVSPAAVRLLPDRMFLDTVPVPRVGAAADTLAAGEGGARE